MADTIRIIFLISLVIKQMTDGSRRSVTRIMKIYVGNLSFGTTDRSLTDLFATYGEVISAKVILDRESNRSKGFGFVEMSNDAAGEEAIRQLNGRDFDGRNLKVNVAKPESDRTNRGPR
jgi:RNA recognition motif-containing protein